MRHLERHARQRPRRLVAQALVAADPVVSLVLALVVAAPRKNRIALDRLPLKRLALGDPVLERAGLEVEIERLTVGPDRKNPFIILLAGLLSECRRLQRDDHSERDQTAFHVQLRRLLSVLAVCCLDARKT